MSSSNKKTKENDPKNPFVTLTFDDTNDFIVTTYNVLLTGRFGTVIAGLIDENDIEDDGSHKIQLTSDYSYTNCRFIFDLIEVDIVDVFPIINAFNDIPNKYLNVLQMADNTLLLNVLNDIQRLNITNLGNMVACYFANQRFNEFIKTEPQLKNSGYDLNGDGYNELEVIEGDNALCLYLDSLKKLKLPSGNYMFETPEVGDIIPMGLNLKYHPPNSVKQEN
jgi:hypothetical protein